MRGRFVKFNFVAAVALLCAVVTALSGCASILEGDRVFVTPHTALTAPEQPEGTLEASTYEELVGAIMELVMKHEAGGNINIFSYEGDVQDDVTRACEEIVTLNPIGAYAVTEVGSFVTQIVSYYEVEIDLTYRRSRAQVDAIVNVSTLRYLRAELLDLMNGYREDAAILTTVTSVSPETVAEYVRDCYYENPLRIMMMPVVTVEVYPSEGTERMIELTFGNRYPPSVLRADGLWLVRTAQSIAESVEGESDGEILLSLCVRMTELAEYDEASAGIAQFGAQNFTVTAYGALNGSAIGEGYAMAYKALCDELGLECDVVLGEVDGRVHAWNIVACDGAYYHVDTAMCDINGIDTAFFKTDADMAEHYVWDRARYKTCDGELTYADFVPPEVTPPLEQDPGDNDGDGDENPGGDTDDNESDAPGGTTTPDDTGADMGNE
jgi:hypothetical protein